MKRVVKLLSCFSWAWWHMPCDVEAIFVHTASQSYLGRLSQKLTTTNMLICSSLNSQ